MKAFSSWIVLGSVIVVKYTLFYLFTTHLPLLYAVYLVDPEGQTTPSKIADVADTVQTHHGTVGTMYWAPDNQRVGLFASGADDVLRLNIVNTAIGNLTMLHGREGGSWQGWNWSPDSTLMAAGHQSAGGEWELGAVDPATDTFTVLAPGRSPAWSKLPLILPPPEPFLELPFGFSCSQADPKNSYGGTDAEFEATVNGNVRVTLEPPPQSCRGRINSYFDHEYPLYPSNWPYPWAVEPIEFGNSLVTFIGTRRNDIAYSGHDAYDFATYIWKDFTTPVFAAADGYIQAVESIEGALYVEIRHANCATGESNGYITRYVHLVNDSYYQNMRSRQGECLQASSGERIGTMGATGLASGPHLHFAVYFDENGNGRADPPGELVDPFGYYPSQEIPNDPWSLGIEDAKGTWRSGLTSYYLWVHPLDDVGQFAPGQALVLNLPASNVNLYMPSNALAMTTTLRIQAVPDPNPGVDLASGGHTINLSARENNDNFLAQFLNPLNLNIGYTNEDIIDLNPATLGLYWWNNVSETWERISATLPPSESGLTTTPMITATIGITRTGIYALMGQPLSDLISPKSTLVITGTLTGISDQYNGPVTASVIATDAGGSGLAGIEFSLDGGVTWQHYTDPIEIEADTPTILLVSSFDNAGNVEWPPKTASFNYFVRQVYLPAIQKNGGP